MVQPRIFIGPFERRVFSDGLRTLLEEDGAFSVSELPTDEAVRRHLDAETPTILILEHTGERERYPLPTSPNVGVILISQDGADVQISLKQLDARRLRVAIGLVEEAEHPKVVSFAAKRHAEPPCILPQFRKLGDSALAPLVAWLDASLGAELVKVRDADHGGGASWDGELERLIAQHHAGDLNASDTDARFDELLEAPVWHRRLLGALSLDTVEIKAVCLAAAPDIDQKYCRTIGFLQGDYNQTRPNASTLARLLRSDLVGGDFDAFCANRRPFSRLKLVRCAESEKPGAAQPGLSVAPPLLEFLLGVRTKAGAGWVLQEKALPAHGAIVDALSDIDDDVQTTATFVITSDSRNAVDECCAALVALEREVLRVDAAGLAAESHPRTALLDHVVRARVEQAVLVIEGLNAVPDDVCSTVMGTDLGGLLSTVAYAGSHQSPKHATQVRAIEVTRADTALCKDRWRVAAENVGIKTSDEDVAQLAARLRFSLADIEMAVQLAAGDESSAPTASERLLAAARVVSAKHAPRAVRRPPCVFRWKDIVLPEEIEADIRSIPAQVANGPRVLDDWGFSKRLSYGRGIGALFSGQSGTGKTMSAQIIARELQVDLMQVELSRCVSKYIGETEKNIDACFTAAEAASAVLLFDEADALFGKRTEIKDAHDRHANVETAYLLQRIEAYEGLVILTTNLKSNIDAAFLRRLRFVVDFQMPDGADRKRIWERAFPDAVTFADDVDVAFLARRLQLSGGSIQQIAVNAAFAAVGEGDRVHMRHIMAATRSELRKMGMLSAERELRDPASVSGVEEAVAT